MTIEMVVVGLALIGSVLNARKSVLGFYFWIAANTLGCILFYALGLYYLLALYTIYVFIAIYGIFYWKRHD